MDKEKETTPSLKEIIKKGFVSHPIRNAIGAYFTSASAIMGVFELKAGDEKETTVFFILTGVLILGIANDIYLTGREVLNSQKNEGNGNG